MSATRGFGEIAENLRRATVRVISQTRGAEGAGSGVVWDNDGTVVTNAHVAHDRTRVELWDGSAVACKVDELDTRKDLAKIKLDRSDIPAVSWRDSTSLREGEAVIAVGHPLGFEGALTRGVIRACGPIRGWDERRWVQASVRLGPGNSGGPLADSEGRVVGINTMVVSSRAGHLGLAIPAEAVADFLKYGPRPALGVAVRPVADPAGRTALLVLDVTANSLAEHASLKTGDRLVAANGREFESVGDLGSALDRCAGQILRLQFLRGEIRTRREVAIALPGPRREAA